MTTEAMPQAGVVVPEWTLGWRLQRALSHASMGAEEMAAELGVSRATVSRWMHDRGAPPKAAYQRQWALRTGVPFEWLQRGEVSPAPDGTPAAEDQRDELSSRRRGAAADKSS